MTGGVETTAATSVSGGGDAPFAWSSREPELMTGFPPSPDVRVTPRNFRDPAAMKWLQLNTRSFGLTAPILRAADAPSPLPQGVKEDLEALVLDDPGGGAMTVAEWMNVTRTDAMLVMREGSVVYERYRHGVTADTPHAIWSITKSFAGAIAAMMANEGSLDLSRKAQDYVSELTGSGFGEATVQQLLDMTTGDDYGENIAKDSPHVLNHTRTFFPNSMPPDEDAPKTLYELLPTIGRLHPPGEIFSYNTADTEALAWIIQRVAGKHLATLISERFWRPLGAEHDASILVDSVGMPVAGAGMSVTLRDLARFGQMLCDEGRFAGRTIVPADVIADLLRGGDREAFARGGGDATRPGYSYRNYWWVDHRAGSIEAKGGSGQHLYVNPAARTVIVKFSAAVDPSTTFSAHIDRPAFAAIVRG